MIRVLALMALLLGACADEIFFTPTDAGAGDFASAPDLPTD
jgi:hypothetical protein